MRVAVTVTVKVSVTCPTVEGGGSEAVHALLIHVAACRLPDSIPMSTAPVGAHRGTGAAGLKQRSGPRGRAGRLNVASCRPDWGLPSQAVERTTREQRKTFDGYVSAGIVNPLQTPLATTPGPGGPGTNGGGIASKRRSSDKSLLMQRRRAAGRPKKVKLVLKTLFSPQRFHGADSRKRIARACSKAMRGDLR